jgi:F0F1-type ATP synthase assembly protein I
MAKPDGSKAPSLTTFQALTIASQFGGSVAVAVVVGLLAGQWLDNRLGTGLVFTLIGVFLGMGTAAVTTVRTYRSFLARNEEVRRQTTAPAEQMAEDDHTKEVGRDHP